MTRERLDFDFSEELILRLVGFGFSVNQAKVYLSIVQANVASVAGIAKDTGLHMQDIYKVLPKLERRGLIAKVIGRPVRFETLSIDSALNRLFSEERNAAEKKIAGLAADLEALKKGLKARQATVSTEGVDPHFMLLTTDAEICNKLALSFAKIRRDWSVVTDLTLAPRLLSVFRERIGVLEARGVETRFIVENPSGSFEAARTVLDGAFGREEAKCFKVKQTFREAMVPFRLFDGKEVWIVLAKETESGQPCFLWTDSPNIVRFYRQNFEKAWIDPEAQTVMG
jgi:sugar-specific transcriptional regulator TrmB